MTADGFTHNFVLKAPELRRLIDKTRFAISTEETRYYLNGIYVHAHELWRRMVTAWRWPRWIFRRAQTACPA